MGNFIHHKAARVSIESSGIDGGIIIESAREYRKARTGLIKSRGNRLRKTFAALYGKKAHWNIFSERIDATGLQQPARLLAATRYSSGLVTELNAAKEFANKSVWINRHRNLTLIRVRCIGNTLVIYFYHENRIVRLAFFVDELLKILRPHRLPDQHKSAKRKSVLQRAIENPIIRPYPANRWESDAVFNAGALHLGNKVHLIYRAIGESGLSVFGYASSENGTQINERAAEPSFISGQLLTNEKKNLRRYPYSSGGSWWGSEDPRLTRVDDTIYMTYTAFDGHHPPCVALTSIHVDDFLNREWNWKPPRIISQPGITNKNWVVFPEKINGKFAVMHSITPQVSIAYMDSLDFEDGGFITSNYYSKGREEYWDNWIRGVGPPPIKTEDGWLVLYHAMDRKDPDRYKIGAMLLDEKSPEKILHRSDFPLLEPDQWYENNGHKRGVVYTCGAALLREKLFVYYGGSDSFLCAAMIDLNTLLSQLKNNDSPRLHILNYEKHGTHSTK